MRFLFVYRHSASLSPKNLVTSPITQDHCRERKTKITDIKYTFFFSGLLGTLHDMTLLIDRAAPSHRFLFALGYRLHFSTRRLSRSLTCTSRYSQVFLPSLTAYYRMRDLSTKNRKLRRSCFSNSTVITGQERFSVCFPMRAISYKYSISNSHKDTNERIFQVRTPENNYFF